MANDIPKAVLDSITYEINGEIEEVESGEYSWEEKEHYWKDGQEFRVYHRHSKTCIATILKPILSPDEYERRRQMLEAACVKLFLAHERALAKKAAEEAKRKEAIPPCTN